MGQTGNCKASHIWNKGLFRALLTEAINFKKSSLEHLIYFHRVGHFQHVLKNLAWPHTIWPICVCRKEKYICLSKHSETVYLMVIRVSGLNEIIVSFRLSRYFPVHNKCHHLLSETTRRMLGCCILKMLFPIFCLSARGQRFRFFHLWGSVQLHYWKG